MAVAVDRGTNRGDGHTLAAPAFASVAKHRAAGIAVLVALETAAIRRVASAPARKGRVNRAKAILTVAEKCQFAFPPRESGVQSKYYKSFSRGWNKVTHSRTLFPIPGIPV